MKGDSGNISTATIAAKDYRASLNNSKVNNTISKLVKIIITN